MNSPPNHEWEAYLDIDDYDLRLTPVEGREEYVMSTQEYIIKVIEDVGEDDNFTCASWLSVLEIRIREIKKTGSSHLALGIEDVKPEPNLSLLEIIILDPDDQLIWESAKTIASTPNSAIIQLDVDDNFVINSTHLNMIRENKFDGYLRADPHDHIREFLAICNMFRYGKTQSEAVKLMIFPLSLCDEAKFWFNELNEESITSWEQMRKAFINRFFPPSLFNRLLLEIRNFSQNICESLTEAWLRLKNMLRKCHGHGLTKGVIIQIFYHGLDEPTQAILDVTAGGIFLYKSPNQAFQLLEDKVLFNHDWPIKSKNEHHQKSVAFADGSNSNNDKFRLMEKLASLTIKMDSQIISLNEELQDMREKYNELRNGNASKNHLNDDTPMCERHEANYIQSEGNKDRNSHDSFSHQSLHDPNDSKKSLTELNNDVRNDLEDFKRRIRSMRTVHWKLYDNDDRKTTGVLPNKKSKIVNQEPQAKTDLEKSITKFLDGQRVTNMFFKNNFNDMILKMKQNEKNFQTKIKNMERKIDEWSKSQNVSLEQTERTDPPPPQAQTEQVNVVFTESGRRIPDISYFHVFGCPVFIHNHKDHLGKSNAKANDGYFLRYSFVPKAFTVFNIRRQQIKETYHVTFNESIEAIRFTNTSLDKIGIDDSSRYPPDEFIQEDGPSRQYQSNYDISFYIIPHGCLLN
ncbi:reverse transcriptase domain-containing protein [Tanacetum coccineum]